MAERLASALMAGVLAVALASCGTEGSDRPASPGTPDPGPVVVDVASLPGTSLALATMEHGAPPSVPWVEGDVLHTANGDVRVAGPGERLGYWSVVVPYGDGALRLLEPDGRRSEPAGRLQFLDSTGTVTRSVAASAPLLSADHNLAAWWEYDAAELVVADTGGHIRQRLSTTAPWTRMSWNTTPRMYMTVVALLGEDDVVLRWEGQARDQTRSGVLRTSAKPVPAWASEPRVADMEGASAAAGLAVISSETTATQQLDANCLDAVDLATSALVWRHCYEVGDVPYGNLSPTFSPDGRHLLVTVVDITTGDPGYLVALDASTGTVTGRFDMGPYDGDDYGHRHGPVDVVFEDNQHFLAVVADRTAAASGRTTSNAAEIAIVRCDVKGGCELATQVVDNVPTRAGEAPSPYWLD